MRLSDEFAHSPADAQSNNGLRDVFYQQSNAERNIQAALENYVLRTLPRRRNGVVIGCREPFVALNLAVHFETLVAVDEDAAVLAEIAARRPQVVTCQIEPDDFKLIGRTDMILVAHLLQSLGAWLETPEERNHQRLAFLNHYVGSLEAGGVLVLLQNRPQNNYKHLLGYAELTPSEESEDLFRQVKKGFSAEHYLFPIEINTNRPADMAQALGYLLADNADWTDGKKPALATYVQTLQQLDGHYYFNYEAELLVIRKNG